MEENFKIKEIDQQSIYQQQTQQPKKRRGLISLFNRKNLPKTITAIIIILLLIAVGAIIRGRLSFSRANIDLNIGAPQDIASGKEIFLTIKYQNNNRVNLNDVYLVLDFPSGIFSIEGKELHREQRSLKTINRKSGGQEEFNVRIVGEKGEAKTITATLDYQPKNINSRFENTAANRLEINSVLISIKIDGPDNAMAGQEVSYLVEYENKTNKDISDLKIEAEYNKDFKVKDINPQPIKDTNNVWQLDNLKAGEKRSINLVGNLEGQEGEDKVLKVTVSKLENEAYLQYSRSEYHSKIAQSPLLLNIGLEEINNEECNLNPGQVLNYKIEFKNNTDVALRELILKVYLEDSVFDFRKINLMGAGFFDSRENIATWAGGEIPALNLLEPNQSGSVNFSVELKRPMPMTGYNDKNFQAIISAEIGTLTVPAKFAVPELKIAKEFSCKINSELSIETKVYYNEPASGIFNTGPLPPKVDSLTTYTIHWQITNGSNDLENVRINAVLPQGISWSNYYVNRVLNSQVYYNERTKEVGWEIQKVPAGIGYILPVYEIIFQIGITPSINQVGSTPTLINRSYAEGKDIFTNTILIDSAGEIDTSIPDDPQAAYIKSRVVE